MLFLPSILPVSVVTQIWTWIANMQYGVIQNVIGLFTGGRPLPVLRSPTYFMPSVAVVTIWWTIGFNILLFLAALRSISPESTKRRRSTMLAAGACSQK